ncbi:MAG: hypothetical protein ACJ74Z_16015 [Bryobacteraceae bacterium]
MSATPFGSWWQQIPKPRVPAFCHPFRNRQNALLARVGQVVSNRLEVIQSDWEDDIEDGRPDIETFDTKHRSRVREVNAVLCALQREFPSVDLPSGTHPLDLREEAKTNTTGRGKATQMPTQKVGS